MNKNKLYLVALLVFGIAIAGQTTFAQMQIYTDTNGTQYSVPENYDPYSNNVINDTMGVYYNSQTGSYYDAATGQYSTTAPSGPSVDSYGNNVIPDGFESSNYGTYYNNSTAQYYDPKTGFYSDTAPTGPMYPSPTTTPTSTPTTSIINTGTNVINTTTNPGLPNTGAGGDAPSAWGILALSGSLGLGGTALLRKQLKRGA